MNDPTILVPAEVAKMFGVSPKTVTRWAKAEKIPSFVTPGGHHRFHNVEMIALRDSTRVRWDDAE